MPCVLLIGCDTLSEYWDTLVRKEVKIQHIISPDSSTVIHGAFTPSIGLFDNKKFGIPTWELQTIDPQQTLSLMTAYEALLNSGFNMEKLSGLNIGVFVGVCSNDARLLTQDSPHNPFATGFTPSLIANRISHILGFTGPSMTVDTSCASSLTALHVACSSILNGDCNIALVGGVNGLLHPSMFNVYGGMGMLSPTGESKVFDEAASGFVRGEGCGFIVLQTMEEVRNNVLAIIRSTAINHNGHLAHRIVAPSSIAQENLMHTVLKRAGLSSKDIAYMEAHGTGTKAGDKNEIESIKRVFDDPERQFPAIVGSVKANIGHLEGGAGIAGLIKAVLVINQETAPGNAGLTKLSIDTGESVVISNETMKLNPVELGDQQDGLCAVVNSFGFGGVNVAAVIQAPRSSVHLHLMEKESPLQPVPLPRFHERFAIHKCVNHCFETSFLNCNTMSVSPTLAEQEAAVKREPDTNKQDNSLVETELLQPHTESGYASLNTSAIRTPQKADHSIATLTENQVNLKLRRSILESLYNVIVNDIDFDDDDDAAKWSLEDIGSKNLFSLGLDSISLVQLIGFIKREHGLNFTYTRMIELETLQGIVDTLLHELTC